MNSAWIVVVGTLGGVLLTATAGLVTVYLTGRQQAIDAERRATLEKSKQLRAERRDIYIDFMAAYREMYSRALAIAAQGGSGNQQDMNTEEDAMRVFDRTVNKESLNFSRSYYALTVTASSDCWKAAREVTREIWKFAAVCISGDQTAVEEANTRAEGAMHQLREVMRCDLGVD